jgi:hypothetical protein
VCVCVLDFVTLIDVVSIFIGLPFINDCIIIGQAERKPNSVPVEKLHTISTPMSRILTKSHL